MHEPAQRAKQIPVSGAVLRLRRDLARGMRILANFDIGERTVEVATASDALWAVVRRPRRGGLALRLAHCPSGDCRIVR